MALAAAFLGLDYLGQLAKASPVVRTSSCPCCCISDSTEGRSRRELFAVTEVYFSRASVLPLERAVKSAPGLWRLGYA